MLCTDHHAGVRQCGAMVQCCPQAIKFNDEYLRASRVADAKSWEVCSSLKLLPILPSDVLPSCKISLILSNNNISELKNGSFSGLNLLERSSRSELTPEALLVSVVCVADGVCDQGCHKRPC